MSSKVSCGLRLKNLRNSLSEPKFQALDCCMPRTVIAFRHLGMLLGPNEPALRSVNPHEQKSHRHKFTSDVLDGFGQYLD